VLHQRLRHFLMNCWEASNQECSKREPFAKSVLVRNEQKNEMRCMSPTHYKTKNSKVPTRISKWCKGSEGQREV
jgi:hypothetical protein